MQFVTSTICIVMTDTSAVSSTDCFRFVLIWFPFVFFSRLQEEHPDEDASVRHGQSSRRAYFRELKKVGGWLAVCYAGFCIRGVDA